MSVFYASTCGIVEGQDDRIWDPTYGRQDRGTEVVQRGSADGDVIIVAREDRDKPLL